jgi:hypothetical protein
MRRIVRAAGVRGVALLLAALVALAAPPARAECGGTDLMAELARTEPETHAAILRRAHAVANGRGRFWEVRAPGVAPSYLYGTLHSTEAGARGLPAPALERLADARILLVELSPMEQRRLARRLSTDPGFATSETGPRLSERLGPRQLDVAEGVLASRGMPLSAADRMEPWLLVSMIAVPQCEREMIAAGHPVLDDVIVERAREIGVPVDGLETYEETFAAFDALSEAEMTSLLVDGFAAVPREEDLRRTLESLYHAGEIAAILEFNLWFSERAGAVADARIGAAGLERALIAGRNRTWMERLVPEIEQGGAFAAFGALHLAGQTGIVRMLREAGFRVRRLAR